MTSRGRVRPSKPASILSMIVGIALVLFGVLIAIPTFGGFGVVWTIIALAITVFAAINAFTTRGVAEQVVEFDERMPSESRMSVEERLRRLEELRRSGVVSDNEYQEQRRRIITEL